MSQGFLYILANDSMPGLLKIGKSKDGGVLRADDLYTTGVPEPFQVLAEAHVHDMNIERNIHDNLKSYRPNPDREFFRIDYETCIDKLQVEFPELKWSEPIDTTITRKSKDYWKKYQEELNICKQRAEDFQQYAEENRWFDHKECYDGSIQTRSNFKVYVQQVIPMLQRGLDNRPEAIEAKLKYLKEDDKSMKKDLKLLREKLDYYEEKYKNWLIYTGPCLCNSCTYQREKTWPEPAWD